KSFGKSPAALRNQLKSRSSHRQIFSTLYPLLGARRETRNTSPIHPGFVRCASPQILIEEPVEGLSYCGIITAIRLREPPVSNEHIDFSLAQLDPDPAHPPLLA